MLGSRGSITEQTPPDSANDVGRNRMLLGGLHLLLPLAWQHVDCPARTNAGVLDHPLEHRQQQGDEPKKHQLCSTPKNS